LVFFIGGGMAARRDVARIRDLSHAPADAATP